MTVPPISVVMPVHNGMPYVEDSVRSLLAQRFGAFELVIGDDGSSDGTSETLARLARADPRIRLARRENRSGVAGSLNWVVSMARAPLVAIAHADDLCHPDRLGRQVEVLQSRPDAVAVGSLFRGIDPEGRVVQPPHYWPLRLHSPFAPFAHSSTMFRRAAFDRVGGYRPEAEYWEDLDLYWRLLEIGRIFVIPEVLAFYRHSPVSVRSRESDEKVENALELMYRSTAAFARRCDHAPLLRSGAASVARGRIHPRIFVARSWAALWSGRRPGTLKRLLRRGDLRCNRTSFVSLAFVLGATLSPRAVRLAVCSWREMRNRLARRALRGGEIVEWFPHAASTNAGAASAADASSDFGQTR